MLARVITTAFGELSTEAKVGERLFSEPRFARFFEEHSGGNVNASLATGDPALDTLAVVSVGGAAITNVRAGQSMSCASCHLGAEYSGRKDLATKGVNLFGDFAARSPVTQRSDGHATTIRNAPPLVGLTASLSEGWGLLHWDGEFTTMEELIIGTATGRNFGWLPAEQAEARRHFIQVIRDDDGRGALAKKYGQLSYAVTLSGTDTAIPDALHLPAGFRFDPAHSTDEEILRGCAKLISAYLASLQFHREQNGTYSGSPYDAFLAVNRLPRAPNPGEVPHAYARRLHAAVAALRNPRFIDDPTRKLELHNQSFRFGELELRGMKIFFRGTFGYSRTASAGNCAECHVPPHFTDGSFHNTGEAQESYDTVNGAGAFMKLFIPSLTERRSEKDRALPPTLAHPQNTGVILSLVSASSPNRTDLGLWNVYGNPDLPGPQPVIKRKLNHDGHLSGDDVLALTLGRFKTPSVRDLGQSSPYFHTGRMQTLEEVVAFYQRTSDLAHSGKLRNAPPEFSSMQLDPSDVIPLVAFLRSLNEDYSGLP